MGREQALRKAVQEGISQTDTVPRLACFPCKIGYMSSILSFRQMTIMCLNCCNCYRPFHFFSSSFMLQNMKFKEPDRIAPATVIALPVKDPFHLPRVMILCIDILKRLTGGAS